MSNNTYVRILIADSSPITRLGIIATITRQPSLCIVGEAKNGEEATALCRQLQPDVVLLEARLRSMDGIQAARLIQGHCPQTHVILYTLSETEEDIHQAFEAGAKAYLLKSNTPEVLLDTIRRVMAGETVVLAEIATRLVSRSQISRLTERELDVLRALTSGKSNRDIADTLFIAEGTVKVHIANILKKMRAKDRTHAVVMALQKGLVHLS